MGSFGLPSAGKAQRHYIQSLRQLLDWFPHQPVVILIYVRCMLTSSNPGLPSLEITINAIPSTVQFVYAENELCHGEREKYALISSSCKPVTSNGSRGSYHLQISADRGTLREVLLPLRGVV
jgi:hypothetical protein